MKRKKLIILSCAIVIILITVLIIFLYQPDCKHQSFEQNPETKCTAVPPKDYKWYHAFYYDDKIYEVFESTNRFVIFSAEKDGANRKEIILSEEFNPSWYVGNQLTLCGDTLIFPGENIQMNSNGETVETTVYLLQVNLSDKTIKKVADLTDLPKFQFVGAYVYNDVVHCQLVFKDNIIVYSCNDGKLNEVYSNKLMGICSFGKEGFWFAKNKSENNNETDCIMFFDIVNKSLEKYCDVSGYVYGLCNNENSIFYYSDSTAEGTYNINNVRTIYYSDRDNTYVCLKSTEKKVWDLWCAVGENIILSESENDGEFHEIVQIMSVKVEDFKSNGIDKALYLKFDTDSDNSHLNNVIDSNGNVNFEVEKVEANNEYFKNKTKLVCLTNCGDDVDSTAIQNQVNELLDKYGYDFAIEFINHTEASEQGYSSIQDKYSQMISKGEQIDILSSGMGIEGAYEFEDVSNTYKKCIDKGYFIPINEYFKTDLGKTFYKSYPQWYWDCLSDNKGNIYGRGIIGLGANPLCVVFNDETIKKYDIDISDFNNTYEGLSQYLYSAYEQSKSNQLVMPEDLSYYEYCGFTDFNGIYFNYKNDKFENIFENKNAINYLETVYDFYSKGYITNEENSEEQEVPLSLISGFDALSKEYENAVIISDCYADNDDLNMVTGITSTSKNPDKAFEFLALISTDKEFASLIYCGIEGRNYLVNSDGEKIQNVQAPAFSFSIDTPANPIVSERLNYDNKNAEQAYNEQCKNTKLSPLKDFSLDTSEIKTKYDSIVKINNEFKGLFYGNYYNYESLDSALKAVNKKLKNAGIDDILKELNSQYSNFKK